jgi:hypothetical protein
MRLPPGQVPHAVSSEILCMQDNLVHARLGEHNIAKGDIVIAFIHVAQGAEANRWNIRGEIMKALNYHLHAALLAGLVALAFTASAQAQLSSAQQSALKSSCRSDFLSHCSGVTPGGRDALVCLQKNVAGLSPACQRAVRSTMASAPAAKPKPVPVVRAAPAARPTAAQQKALKKYCRSDFMAHCSRVRPGGQEALACLERNARRLSPACRRAVAALHPAAPLARVAPPPAVVVAPPPPARRPSLVSAAVMLRACKLDLLRHCRGVHAGGGRELACLAAHDDHLTFRCRTALKVTRGIR